MQASSLLARDESSTHLGAWMSLGHSQEVDLLGSRLVDVIRLVRTATDRACLALRERGAPATDRLLDVGGAVQALRRGVEDQALTIQATRAGRTVPDIRAIIVAAQVNSDAEAVADLVATLAGIAWSRGSRPAVPAAAQAVVCQMGQICCDMSGAAADAGGSFGSALVGRVATACAEVGQLQDLLYQRLFTDAYAYASDIDAALDTALVGRYYVRCAEHILSIARHAALLTKGRLG